MERLTLLLTLLCSVVTAATVQKVGPHGAPTVSRSKSMATPAPTPDRPAATPAPDPTVPPRSTSLPAESSPTAAAVPLPGTTDVSDTDPLGRAPVLNPRYSAPTGPAPLVGYAAQAGQPLPSYPGLSPVGTPLPGNPAQTLGAGPLVRLFTDLKACQPGDTVTIVITQQAVANANAQKTSSRDANAGFDGGAGIFKFLPGFSLNYKGSSAGKANQTGDFNISTTFTAVVASVQPNGNLVLEGEQRVSMDGRPQFVKLHGECRSYDISANNTIESTKVANVRIEWNGLRGHQGSKGFFDVVGGAIEKLFGWLF